MNEHTQKARELLGLDEARKSHKDKVPEKWQIVVGIAATGHEVKSKWYHDWNDAYDALGKIVQDLAKKHGGTATNNNISNPEVFTHRYLKSNKE